MAEIITGDKTKSIKGVGELSLRISKFDSYRLFTLYENVNKDSQKVMDVSGNQKYYLVFKSPNKEIRIPEYDPKGFFEVDKVNGCVLFKITKKNAEDILGMKTAGERIFYIIRVYEETDAFGKVLSVTDEVEVYRGKWGDDEAFTTFTTENKVDLLTKSLAAQLAKNETQLAEYADLLEKYNKEVVKNSELQSEVTKLQNEKQTLEAQLSEYVSSTYDGTVLSTDTKYIAFEDTLDNVTFTEEQYQKALGELMTKGEIDFTSGEYTDIDMDLPKINLDVKVEEEDYNIKVNVYKNNIDIGAAMYGYNLEITSDSIEDNPVYVFEYSGGNVKEVVVKTTEGNKTIEKTTNVYMQLQFIDFSGEMNDAVSFKVGDEVFKGSAEIKLAEIGNNIVSMINISNMTNNENQDVDISAIGVIGRLCCKIIPKTTIKETINNPI